MRLTMRMMMRSTMVAVAVMVVVGEGGKKKRDGIDR